MYCISAGILHEFNYFHKDDGKEHSKNTESTYIKARNRQAMKQGDKGKLLIPASTVRLQLDDCQDCCFPVLTESRQCSQASDKD